MPPTTTEDSSLRVPFTPPPPCDTATNNDRRPQSTPSRPPPPSAYREIVHSDPAGSVQIILDEPASPPPRNLNAAASLVRWQGGRDGYTSPQQRALPAWSAQEHRGMAGLSTPITGTFIGRNQQASSHRRPTPTSTAIGVLSGTNVSITNPPPSSLLLQTNGYVPNKVDNALWDMVVWGWSRHKTDHPVHTVSAQSSPYLSMVGLDALREAIRRLGDCLKAVSSDDAYYPQAMFMTGQLDLLHGNCQYLVPSDSGPYSDITKRTRDSVKLFVERFGTDTTLVIVQGQPNSMCSGRDMEKRIVQDKSVPGSGWLNDELINTGAIIAAAGQTHVQVVVSQQWNSFRKNGRLPPLGSAANICAIVHLSEHWICLWAHRDSRMIQVFDSYPTSTGSRQPEITAFRALLQAYYPAVAPWTRRRDTGPHQSNMADCGMWVIAHIRAVATRSTGAPAHEDILRLRQRLADEILIRAIEQYG